MRGLWSQVTAWRIPPSKAGQSFDGFASQGVEDGVTMSRETERWAPGAAAVIALFTWCSCGASVEAPSSETTAVEAREENTPVAPPESSAERPVLPVVTEEERRTAMAFLELWVEHRTHSGTIILSIMDHTFRAQAESGDPPRFPPSAPQSPEIACCRGADGRCPVDSSHWEASTWRALGFSIDEPHRLQYEYRSEESSYTLRSEGDLECRGRTVRFERTGAFEEGLGVVSEQSIEVAPDAQGRGLNELTADLVAIYAERVCAAAEGGASNRELHDDVDHLRLFIERQVRRNHRELLERSRPAENALEQRILDASAGAARCMAVMETRRY